MIINIKLFFTFTLLVIVLYTNCDIPYKWFFSRDLYFVKVAQIPICGFYRIGGIFQGEKFLQISLFRKKLYTENKILYGSHLIFD